MSARAAVVIVQDGQVALIERNREDRHYFTFPGGGVDEGETPEQTAVREAKEELGFDVVLRRLVAEIWFQGKPQWYYLAEVVGGVFGTGVGPEMVSPYLERGTYRPIWMSIERVLDEPVLPRPMAELLVRACRSDWPDPPPVIHENHAHPAHPSGLHGA